MRQVDAERLISRINNIERWIGMQSVNWRGGPVLNERD